MSKASSTNPGLFQRLLTSRPAPMFQDPADFGTCFGLDLSLDQSEAPPAPVAAAPRATPSWVQRLTLRPRGAA